jgi:hypothetical protein
MLCMRGVLAMCGWLAMALVVFVATDARADNPIKPATPETCASTSAAAKAAAALADAAARDRARMKELHERGEPLRDLEAVDDAYLTAKAELERARMRAAHQCASERELVDFETRLARLVYLPVHMLRSLSFFSRITTHAFLRQLL